MTQKYETVIGLEVHVQLATKSKAFCGCSTKFGQKPNSSVCSVCLGLPGVLPVLNKEAFRFALTAALALNCQIQERVKFDRKNYYYPDLPKNYQISQYDMPLAFRGYLNILSKGQKRINITRVHLEEDAGKLIHDPNKSVSYVDYNRAGTPLLEIVSEPEIRSADEAYEYLKNLKAILLYLGVSDCNMEEGSLRCDANISIRKMGDKKLGTKVELKNMNSFKAVRLALITEERDLVTKLENGTPIIQATKLWNAETLSTAIMRTKEETQEYRYFPEPDLVPFVVDKKEAALIKETLPELPEERKKRFISEFELTDTEAEVIIADKAIADYFEKALNLYNQPKKISNWLAGDIMSELNLRNISISQLQFLPEGLAELLNLIDNKTISGKMAKDVLKECIAKGKSPNVIVKEGGLRQISDESEIEGVINDVIISNDKAANDFKNGKENALTFLVGKVMQKTKGKANPAVVNKLLRDALK